VEEGRQAEALDRLTAWQRSAYTICKLLYAFIAGENDSKAAVQAICDAWKAGG